MQTVKKLSLIFIGILLISGSAYGGFYFFKRNIKATPHNEVTPSQTNESLVGLKRDIKGNIDPIFPKGLINEKDVSKVIESFVFKDTSPKTQYTFKYVSKMSYFESTNYFIKTLSNGFQNFTLSDFFKDDINQITAFSLKNENTDELFITISNLPDIGAVVDITYTK